MGGQVNNMNKSREHYLDGQRFRRLIVIKDSGRRKKNGVKVWECKCDCNNITFTTSSRLISGRTKSCGCLSYEIKLKLAEAKRLPTEVVAVRNLMSRYKLHAKEKNVEFKLTTEQCNTFFKLPCHYCGKTPQQIKKVRRKYNITFYIYNGIDAVDNTKDYTVDNVVTACGTCNKAKNNQSVIDFFEWVKTIYKLHNLGKDKVV